jgi:hypothetical protein
VKNQRLKHAIFLVGALCMLFLCAFRNVHADTYTDGVIVVKHEELPIKKNGRRIQFNWPLRTDGKCHRKRIII